MNGKTLSRWLLFYVPLSMLFLSTSPQALADFLAKVTNNTPYDVLVSLNVKARGKGSFTPCPETTLHKGTKYTKAGSFKEYDCPSVVKNWKRKFQIKVSACKLLVPKECMTNNNHSKEYTWQTSAQGIVLPKNGKWYAKNVIKDQGIYAFSISANLCDKNKPEAISEATLQCLK
jgi:hypothetical protein